MTREQKIDAAVLDVAAKWFTDVRYGLFKTMERGTTGAFCGAVRESFRNRYPTLKGMRR